MTCDNIFNTNKIDKKDIYIKENYCFILIDTETCNGFDRRNNAIVQLAFMFLGTNHIYNTYCKPDDTIPWKERYEKFSPKIKKEDVNNSPSLKDVLISFKNIIYYIDNVTPILIAHNSQFDKNMLNICLDYYNIKIEQIKWCNSMNNLIFNIKDENNKSIKSLEKITKYLFKDSCLDFHNAKNDVENLYNCLLKVHDNNEKITSKILKIIKKNNKDEEDLFLLEYKNILENFNEFCNFDVKNIDINELEYINLYENVLQKEKEISKFKNMIKDKIIKLLKDNNNYLYSNNKEVLLNEYNMRQIDSKKIKDKYPDIYNECIKEIKYNKIIIKEH